MLRRLFGLVLVIIAGSAFLLYAPNPLLERLAVLSLRESHQGILSQVLLYASAGGMGMAVLLAGIFVANIVKKARQRQSYRLSLLKRTSQKQREHLREFMRNDDPVPHPVLDESIYALRQAKILRVNGKHASPCIVEYTLTPWARRILTEHYELLAVQNPTLARDNTNAERSNRHAGHKDTESAA